MANTESVDEKRVGLLSLSYDEWCILADVFEGHRNRCDDTECMELQQKILDLPSMHESSPNDA